jgi:hypothetical protein
MTFPLRQFDVNNDGKLSAEELKPALQSLGFNPTDADVQVSLDWFTVYAVQVSLDWFTVYAVSGRFKLVYWLSVNQAELRKKILDLCRVR